LVDEGLKYEKQIKISLFGVWDSVSQCVVAEFENRIWAEKEIEEKGMKFETRFGPGIGFETLNDTVLKLLKRWVM